MGMINQKLLRQRISEKESKITDKQFFTSRLLAAYFEDIAEAQTRRFRYGSRVRVNLYWNVKEDFVASTDNMVIKINCGTELIRKVQGRENRFRMVSGIFAHELGHILYTDFLAEQTRRNYLSKSIWYPDKPECKTILDDSNALDMLEYVKADGKNADAVKYVSGHISNILEDGYIEERILNRFPGSLGQNLKFVRKNQFEGFSTVTEMKEKEEGNEAKKFASIMQIILSYSKYGEIKYGDEPLTDERIKVVFGLLTDIDDALFSVSVKKRLNCTNLIMVRCWQYAKAYCEELKNRYDEMLKSGLESSIKDALKAMLGASGVGEDAEGEGTAMDPSATEEGEPTTTGKRNKTKSRAGKAGSKNVEPGSVSESNENNGSTDESDGRIPLYHTDSVSEPEGGELKRNDEYEAESIEETSKTVKDLLSDMAKESAAEELESERIREMNDFAKSISYGNVHKGVGITVNRMSRVTEAMKEQYESLATDLIPISKQLQKSLLKELKETDRTGKQTGLLTGRRLDSHTLYRDDGKVFCKNNLPIDGKDLAVALLVDESGSMCCSGRFAYAQSAAIILYDFCKALNVPCTIYGHSTDYNGDSEDVAMYSYTEFDGFDENDKYRLIDIRARRNNRDGAALRFMAEKLSKRSENVKLLMLISDGQPAASGYYGTAAEEDLRGIQHEYKRKGVLFVAAAIGDDKENISRIYGDAFMDISDIKQLPMKLTNVVKKFIR